MFATRALFIFLVCISSTALDWAAAQTSFSRQRSVQAGGSVPLVTDICFSHLNCSFHQCRHDVLVKPRFGRVESKSVPTRIPAFLLLKSTGTCAGRPIK